MICSLHRKDSKLECNNYCGIALVNVMYKILEICIQNNLVKQAEERLVEYQCGLWKGRRVFHQIFSLQVIQADTIRIDGKLVNLVRMTLAKTENQVRTRRNISASFEVKQGRGDPLSAMLLPEKVIREAGINRSVPKKASINCFRKRHSNLMFVAH